jgi:hypothetical protein
MGSPAQLVLSESALRQGIENLKNLCARISLRCPKALRSSPVAVIQIGPGSCPILGFLGTSVGWVAQLVLLGWYLFCDLARGSAECCG